MHAGVRPVSDDIGPTRGQCATESGARRQGPTPAAVPLVAAPRPAVGESNGYFQ